jgi:hypothetical protein
MGDPISGSEDTTIKIWKKKGYCWNLVCEFSATESVFSATNARLDDVLNLNPNCQRVLEQHGAKLSFSTVQSPLRVWKS